MEWFEIFCWASRPRVKIFLVFLFLGFIHASQQQSTGPDITISDFAPKSTNPIAIKGVAKLLQFDLKIKNSDTANAISALAAGKKNYQVDFYFAYANVGSASIAGTTSHQLTVTTEPSNLNFGLAAAASSGTLTFTVKATLPSTNCNKFIWFCGCVKKGADAVYIDGNANNNCACTSAVKLISCSPDIRLNIPPTPGNEIQTGLFPNKAKTLSVTFNIKNDAPANSGNTIVASTTSDNYAIDVYLAQANLGITPSATKTAAFPAKLVNIADLKVALTPGAVTSILTMTASVTLPITDCVKYKWLCACVKEGPGAQYIDANDKNNCQCVDMSVFFKCHADITLDAVNPGTDFYKSMFFAGIAKTLTATISIKNLGNSIAASTTGDNFAVEVYWAQFDLIRTPSATKTAAFPAKLDKGDLKVALAPGAVTPLQAMSASGVTLPLKDCLKYKWLCVCVKKGLGAKYVDGNDKNNCRCLDITYFKNVKCPADIAVDSFNPAAGTYPIFESNIPNTLTKFQATIKNHAGIDIPASSYSDNYAFDIHFAQADLATTPTAIKTPPFQAVPDPGNLKFALALYGVSAQQILTAAGVTFPITQCSQFKWLCLCVRLVNTQFYDTKTENNCQCRDASAKIKCVATDIKVLVDGFGTAAATFVSWPAVVGTTFDNYVVTLSPTLKGETIDKKIVPSSTKNPSVKLTGLIYDTKYTFTVRTQTGTTFRAAKTRTFTYVMSHTICEGLQPKTGKDLGIPKGAKRTITCESKGAILYKWTHKKTGKTYTGPVFTIESASYTNHDGYYSIDSTMSDEVVVRSYQYIVVYCPNVRMRLSKQFARDGEPYTVYCERDSAGPLEIIHASLPTVTTPFLTMKALLKMDASGKCLIQNRAADRNVMGCTTCSKLISMRTKVSTVEDGGYYRCYQQADDCASPIHMESIGYSFKKCDDATAQKIPCGTNQECTMYPAHPKPLCLCKRGYSGKGCTLPSPPDVLSDITISAVTSTTAAASWSKVDPEKFGKFDNYQITIHPYTNGEKVENPTISSLTEVSPSTTFSSLRPDIVYTVKVFTVKGGITGKPNFAKFYTPVSCDPTDLKLLYTDLTKATVYWKKAMAGDYDTFKATLSPTTNGEKIDQESFASNSGTSKVELSNLKAGTEYTFELKAMKGSTVVGTKQKTFKLLPPTPPELTVSTITKTSAKVSWKKGSVAVNSYEATISPNKDGEKVDSPVPGDTSSPETTVSNLKPARLYYVTVVAVIGTVRSNVRVVKFHTAPESIVSDLTISTTNGQVIFVSWPKPTGYFSHYIVTLSPSDKGAKVKDPVVAGNAVNPQVEIGYFLSGVTYMITVQTVAGNTAGDPKTKKYILSDAGGSLVIQGLASIVSHPLHGKIAARSIPQGTKHTIKCVFSAKGSSALSYQWTHKPTGNTYTGSEVTFDPVKRESHEGMWKCEVKLNSGIILFQQGYVFVHCTSIRFSHDLQKLHVYQGKQYNMYCEVDSASGPVEIQKYHMSIFSQTQQVAEKYKVQAKMDVQDKCWTDRKERQWTFPKPCSTTSKLLAVLTTSAVFEDSGYYRCFQSATGCASPIVHNSVIVVQPFQSCDAKCKTDPKCAGACSCMLGYQNDGSGNCVLKSPPDILSDITVKSLEPTKVTISWNAVDQSKFDQYQFRIWPNSNGETAPNPGKTPEGTFSKLKPDTVYTLAVFTVLGTKVGSQKYAKILTTKGCDDAQRTSYGCSDNADCRTSTTPNCVCKTGFKGDGKTCTDIDECGNSPCHISADCVNTPGSYKCTCKKGYVGDGVKICLEISGIVKNAKPFNAVQGGKFRLTCGITGAKSYTWFFISSANPPVVSIVKDQNQNILELYPADRKKHEGYWGCFAPVTTTSRRRRATTLSYRYALLFVFVCSKDITLMTTTSYPPVGKDFSLKCTIISPTAVGLGDVKMGLNPVGLTTQAIGHQIIQGTMTTAGTCTAVTGRQWTEPIPCKATSTQKTYTQKTAAAKATDTGFWRCSMNGHQSPPIMIRVITGVDLIILGSSFKPIASNPVAIMNVAKTLAFELVIQNNGPTGYDIAAVTAGRNYDVDFYFSFADLSTTPVGSTTTYKLTNTMEPTNLNFALPAGATSGLLTYKATATLPTTSCDKYTSICGCVKKGAAAAYSDSITTNNCVCKKAWTLISCNPDIMLHFFDPKAGTYPIFLRNTPNNLEKFKIDIKNNAGSGNQIVKSTTGDNFAIDVYFAHDNLETNPTAVKTQPFAATLDSGDLTVALAPGAVTAMQTLTARGIKLPTTDCTKYRWLCACVKQGPGAQSNIDKYVKNNCRCVDASAAGMTKCDVEGCDDAQRTSYGCSDNADCRTSTTPNCVCKTGFKGDDGKTCTDIDECGNSPCHTSAECENTPGSYKCTCKKGYVGDGVKICLEISRIVKNAKPFNAVQGGKFRLTCGITSAKSYTWFFISSENPPVVSIVKGQNQNVLELYPADRKKHEGYWGCFAPVTATSRRRRATTLSYQYALLFVFVCSKDITLMTTTSNPPNGKDFSLKCTIISPTAVGFGNVEMGLNPVSLTTQAIGHQIIQGTVTTGGCTAVTGRQWTDPIPCKATSTQKTYTQKTAAAKVTDTGFWRCSVNGHQSLPIMIRVIMGVDIIIPATSFNPLATNPIAIMNVAKTLAFELQIKNNGPTGYDIAAVASGSRNYDVDFYFSFADLSTTPVGSTTTYKLTNTVEPTNWLHIALSGGSVSSNLNYKATATLPTTSCDKYLWICSCVKKGAAAVYHDSDATNNCVCKKASTLISCYPDIMLNSFDPNAGTYPIFISDTPNTLEKFKVNIKNDAGPGNQIVKSTTGANFAVDVYFAQDNLETMLTAVKTQPFAATLNSGDLSVSLAPWAVTAMQILTSGGIKLPTAGCSKYRWLCACVKQGRGAQSNIDKNGKNNCRCVGASAAGKTKCKIDIILKDVIPVAGFNSPLLPNQAVTLSAKLSIANNDPATSGNTIAASTAGDNFAVEVYWAQANLEVTPSATKSVAVLAGLNTGSGDLKVALAPGTATPLQTMSVSATLPDKDCAKFNWVCVCVKEGSGARYVDGKKDNNCKCFDVTAYKKCPADIQLGTLTPNVGSTTLILANKPVTLSAKLTIKNSDPATGNTIAASTTDNFAIDVCLAKANLEITPSATKTVAVPAKLVHGDLKVALAPGTETAPQTMSVDATFPDKDCTKFNWVCVRVKEGLGAKYVDRKKDNNCKCFDMTAHKKCPADIQLGTLTPNVGSTTLILANKPVTLSAKLTIKNSDPATGNTIAASTTDNFAIDVCLAKANLETTPSATKTVAVPAKLVSGDLKVALAPGKETAPQTMSVDATFPDKDCTKFNWVCVHVKEGAQAKYVDRKKDNNYKCFDMTAHKKCPADIILGSVSPNVGSTTLFFANKPMTVSPTLTIKNNDPTTSGNSIPASGSGENFAIVIYWAQADLEATPSAAKTAAFPAKLDKGDLKVALAPGAITGVQTMTASSVTLPLTDCLKYKWLCACVKEGKEAKFIDRNRNNNCKCSDMTASKQTRCTTADIKLDIFTPGTQIKLPIFTGTEYKSEFTANKGKSLRAEVLIRNNEPLRTGYSIAASTTGDNYALVVHWAQADLRLTPSAAKSAPFPATLVQGNLKVALAPGAVTSIQTLSIKGVTLPSKDCTKYKWLCVCVMEGKGAQFVDVEEKNNCVCIDMTTYKNTKCPADIAVDYFHYPFIYPIFDSHTAKTLRFNVGIKNHPPGNDIPASTSSDNYVFDVYFAQASLATTPTATKTSPFRAFPVWGNLRFGLRIGQSSVREFTASGMKLPVAECAKYKWLCMCVRLVNRRYYDHIEENNCRCRDASADQKIKCIENSVFYPYTTGWTWSSKLISWRFGYRWSGWGWKWNRWSLYPRCMRLRLGQFIPFGCDTFEYICVNYYGLLTLHHNWREIYRQYRCLLDKGEYFKKKCQEKPNSKRCGKLKCGMTAFIAPYVMQALCPERTSCISFNMHQKKPNTNSPWYMYSKNAQNLIDQTKLFKKVDDDIHAAHPKHSSFETENLFVVTFNNMEPLDAPKQREHFSVQVALASDERQTFLVTMFANFKLNKVFPKTRCVAIRSYFVPKPYSKEECSYTDPTNTAADDTLSTVDQVKGNTGENGKDIIDVGAVEENYLETRCRRALNKLESIKKDKVPCTCPHDYLHMRWYGQNVLRKYFWGEHIHARRGEEYWQYTTCFSQTPYWWRNTLPSGTKDKLHEVCCYKRTKKPKTWKEWDEWFKKMRSKIHSWQELRRLYILERDDGFLLVEKGNTAGYAYTAKDYKTAKDARKYCCLEAPKYCHLFKKHLPVSCSDYFKPPDELVIRGDPHFRTLDGASYSFNGQGEYVLVKGAKDGKEFTVQCRTTKARSAGTKEAKATVFSACAMKASDADLVEVGIDGSSNLRTLLNKEKVVAYSSVTENGTDFNNVAISRPENASQPTVIVAYPGMFTLTIGLRKKLLALQVDVFVDPGLKGATKGLLGNYNGDKNDDFMKPDGKTIPITSSERDIYYKFGLKWRVPKSQSMFKEPVDHDADFTPIFMEDYKNKMNELFNDDKLLNKAKGICSKHKPKDESKYLACMYDASQMATTDAATENVESETEEEENKKIKDNHPPTFDMPKYVRVAKEKLELEVKAKDTDPGDTVTLSLKVKGTGADVTLADDRKLSILVKSDDPFSFEITAEDSLKSSSIWQPQIHACQVVNKQQGKCDFTNVEDDEKEENEFRFYVADVNCTDDWSGDRCEIGPCDGETSPCPKGTTCTPKDGKAECGPCPDGTKAGILECIDIDECSLSPPPCQHKKCRNEPENSYTCSCNDGYRVDAADKNKCVDIDECAVEGLNKCSAAKNEKCVNKVGSFECSCIEGFGKVGGQCIDIDECKTSAHKCPANAVCRNTAGGYECDCKPGYYKSGIECKDQDECASSDTNKCQHICTNTIGSYTCSCKSGYTLAANKHNCEVPISAKCDQNNVCEQKEKCIKTNGVDTCTCDSGYVLSANKVTCIDVDECKTGANKCSVNCINLVGGHKCGCNAGYQLNGDGVSCSNIDECATKTATCPEHSTCTDTDGSYTCPCKKGYSGSSCTDVNECEDPNLKACGTNADCINYDGGYRCRCKKGHAGDPKKDCSKAANLKYSMQVTLQKVYDPQLDDKSSKAFNELVKAFIAKCLESFADLCKKAVCSFDVPSFGRGSTIIYLDMQIYSAEALTDPGIQPDQATVKAMFGSMIQTSGGNCYIAGVGVVVCGSNTVNDVNECTAGTHRCTSTMFCVNTPGEYECRCLPGFVDKQTGTSKIDLKCEDVDECTTKCLTGNTTCTNTVGSFICKCKAGFWSKDPLTTDCLDPCEPNPCENNGSCTVSGSSTQGYNCSCPAGYTGITCAVKKEVVTPSTTPEKTYTNITMYSLIAAGAALALIIIIVGAYCGIKKKKEKERLLRSVTPVLPFREPTDDWVDGWPNSRRPNSAESRAASISSVQAGFDSRRASEDYGEGASDLRRGSTESSRRGSLLRTSHMSVNKILPQDKQDFWRY